MIAVEWFVAALAVVSVLHFLTTRALIQEIRALTRALIAKNPADLAMLDKSAPKTASQRRPPPESEGVFTEPRPRVMGLG